MTTTLHDLRRFDHPPLPACRALLLMDSYVVEVRTASASAQTADDSAWGKPQNGY